LYDIEDQKGSGDMPLGYCPTLNEVSLLQLDGVFTLDQFDKCLDLSIEGAKKIYEMQTGALKQKYTDIRAEVLVDEEESKEEPKKESKPEVKEEPKKESKPEVKEEPKEESKPEVKEEPKKESKPEVKEEPKKESKPEVKEEPKKESKPEVKEEPKEESKPEVKEKSGDE
jgi:hypothetical protein